MLFFSPIFRLYALRDLRAFIPTGNQPKLFLCQFSPSPQFRQALSPTELTMTDLSSFSLSTSDIFLWLLPLCRRHAANANTLSWTRPLPWMNAALNEATLLQKGTETPTYYNQWICMPAPDTQSLKHQTWNTGRLGQTTVPDDFIFRSMQQTLRLWN